MGVRRAVAAALALVVSGVVVPARADPLIECAEPVFPDDPPGWAADMPQARETTVTRQDVEVPSADGTRIHARVYHPDAYAGRLPTVLLFSPYWALLGYHEEEEDLGIREYADCTIAFFVARGYAVVLGDMRATHNSDGCFDYGGPGDQADGYALVQWIAGRAWSNRSVGMYGVSHVGMSQYAAAVAAPAALKAIIPIAPVTSFYRYLYSGGVHYETNMLTPAAYLGLVEGPPPTNVTSPNYLTNLAGTPCGLSNHLKGLSLDGTMDAYWRARDYPSMARRIRAAVFHVHGTLDENVKTDHFAAMWRALEAADVPRRALVGPWGHSAPMVGPEASYWLLVALRWYEHWLAGNDTGMMDEPPVTLIDQGGTVRTAERFPPESARRLVLHAGDGALRARAPGGTAVYTDVPGLPRLAVRRAEGARVIYTSEPLAEPLRLSGTAVLDLVASIDTTDTNFAVHLNDVNGFPAYVTRGYLDARHREGLGAAVNVTPGVPLRYRIELHARDYVFDAGHRIEILLSSSDSCHWGVAPGCESSGVVSDTTRATVTVHEGPGQTRLILPSAPL